MKVLRFIVDLFLRVLLMVELERDIAAGKPIKIKARPYPVGHKLIEIYPYMALGYVRGHLPCHETTLNPDEPDHCVHIFPPDAFQRNGSGLPSSLSVWRYQDYWKFQDLLDTQSLYLSRLQDLVDPLEGKPTTALQELINLVELPPLPTPIMAPVLQLSRVLEDIYQSCYVNCWHINNLESQAMWALCSNPRSVTVRTTFGELNETLKEHDHTSVWQVHYLEYQAHERADMINIYSPEFIATHKDVKYRHENELRIVHLDRSNFLSLGSFIRRAWGSKRQVDTSEPCPRIPISLQKVIQEVRVHPQATDRFLNEVRHSVAQVLPQVSVTRSAFR